MTSVRRALQRVRMKRAARIIRHTGTVQDQKHNRSKAIDAHHIIEFPSNMVTVVITTSPLAIPDRSALIQSYPQKRAEEARAQTNVAEEGTGKTESGGCEDPSLWERSDVAARLRGGLTEWRGRLLLSGSLCSLVRRNKPHAPWHGYFGRGAPQILNIFSLFLLFRFSI